MSKPAEIALPPVVVEYVRAAFGAANQRASAKISRMPTTHETSLDLSIIEGLSQFAAPKKVSGEWIVRLDTHYLGGGRHFGQWEVADIGIILVVRDKGLVRTRKTALLQSKRLYPDEQSMEEDVPLDYMIGFGRLMIDDNEDLEVLADRLFHFTPQSRYKALMVGDEQCRRMEQFEKGNGVPVHYLLYHPLVIPWERTIPVEAAVALDGAVRDVGAQVVRASDLRASMKGKNKTYCPTFAEITALGPWSLEGFVADEVLGCREGYLATGPSDQALTQVFSRRGAPIAAALSITIDHV